MKIHNYEKLVVWQKSMDLVQEVYILSEKFPKTELYGLTNQIRRSAVSIPSNIAEGSHRKTDNDFQQFLCIASGSAAELQTQIKIARRLGFCGSLMAEYGKIESLIVEVRKMLFGMVDNLKSNV